MVAVLTRVFGVHNLALVEDVVQDAFCRAVEVWRFRGIPENPSAWLMITAKRRALDVLRRERTARSFAPELGRLLDTEWTLAPILDELFDPHAIQDDQLRLMFSCCHPRLPEATQVALVLHLLCGFTVSEVASAFVSTHAAMEKRLSRGKKVFAGSRALFEVTDTGDFVARLAAVQRALYLLFNEGYHSSSAEGGVRSELCREAIRLARLLVDHPPRQRPTPSRRSYICTGRDCPPGRTRPGSFAPCSIRIDPLGTRHSSTKGCACSSCRLAATRSRSITSKLRSRPSTPSRRRVGRLTGAPSFPCTTP